VGKFFQATPVPGQDAKGHTLEFEKTKNAFFVVCNGIRIAKRGLPNTPQAKTWIPLGPGWEVIDIDGGKQIEVRFNGEPLLLVPGSSERQ
jgi:hypothetical protein